MKLPAGKYYVGDLCYVMSDDRWEEAVALMFEGRVERAGYFKLKDGTDFVTFSTMYGDGEYYDQQGRAYSVDSGSIGCIDMKWVSEADCSGGQIVEFAEDFGFARVEGNINFGCVSIETADEYTEDWSD